MGMTVFSYSASYMAGGKDRGRRHNGQARLMGTNQPKPALCNMMYSSLYLMNFTSIVPSAK